MDEALSSRQIRMSVFDGDSAWGEVDGTPELASEIFAARGQKPIIAVVNTLAASAAHWLAAQADEIVISPSAQAGSIGVWVLHQDLSGQLEKMGVNRTRSCVPATTRSTPTPRRCKIRDHLFYISSSEARFFEGLHQPVRASGVGGLVGCVSYATSRRTSGRTTMGANRLPMRK